MTHKIIGQVWDEICLNNKLGHQIMNLVGSRKRRILSLVIASQLERNPVGIIFYKIGDLILNPREIWHIPILYWITPSYGPRRDIGWIKSLSIGWIFWWESVYFTPKIPHQEAPNESRRTGGGGLRRHVLPCHDALATWRMMPFMKTLTEFHRSGDKGPGPLDTKWKMVKMIGWK